VIVKISREKHGKALASFGPSKGDGRGDRGDRGDRDRDGPPSFPGFRGDRDDDRDRMDRRPERSNGKGKGRGKGFLGIFLAYVGLGSQLRVLESWRLFEGNYLKERLI